MGTGFMEGEGAGEDLSFGYNDPWQTHPMLLNPLRYCLIRVCSRIWGLGQCLLVRLTFHRWMFSNEMVLRSTLFRVEAIGCWEGDSSTMADVCRFCECTNSKDTHSAHDYIDSCNLSPLINHTSSVLQSSQPIPLRILPPIRSSSASPAPTPVLSASSPYPGPSNAASPSSQDPAPMPA